MISLPDFQWDVLSFLSGFLAAWLLWWLIKKARAWLPKIKAPIQQRAEAIREGNISGINKYLRQEMLYAAQHMHIAHPLCSLDEILVPPRVLAPATQIDPQNPALLVEPIVSQALPYLPDQVNLVAQYNLPALTLAQAAQNGVPLAVIGEPGSGKTVALAHLASLVSQQDSAAGKLSECIPVLLHVLDIDPAPVKTRDPLDNIIKSVALLVSVLFQARLPRFLHNVAQNGKLLLMIDGLDELPPAALQTYHAFLVSLLQKYPKTRLIITASDTYLNGLAEVGFYPLVVAPWNNDKCLKFTEKWSRLWSKELSSQISLQTRQNLTDMRLMLNWLKSDLCSCLTPLERTLKIWAAFSGDVLGTRPIHAAESYIQRLTHGIVPHLALESLAYEMIQTSKISLPATKMDRFLSKLKLGKASARSGIEQLQDEAQEDKTSELSGKQKRKKTISSGSKILSTLMESGLLLEHIANQQICFSHPVFTGYLASFSAGKKETALTMENRHLWSYQSILFHYLAVISRNPAWIEDFIREDDPLYRSLLTTARWLRDAPAKAEFRGPVMRKLVQLIQDENQPLLIRYRVLSAFIASADPSLAKFFKQLLSSPSPCLRQLGALGSGAIQNSGVIQELLPLLSDISADVQNAACLALSAINTAEATDRVAKILLMGSENLRRVAAESFAFKGSTGIEVLKEAITLDDLLARRAAVFGLMQIRQKWVLPILEKISLEDSQWVVRNAASQAIEMLQMSNPHIPRKLPVPDSSPWLIAYAGKQGASITPNQPATDILLSALKSQNTNEILAALDYLRESREEDTIRAIYDLLYSQPDDPLIETAGFYALWLIILSGVRMPSLQKFGF